ncbi:MAG: transporter [Planctomycetaceae bacterium]|nr:transporter [Planctomycetaceae bacterium]
MNGYPPHPPLRLAWERCGKVACWLRTTVCAAVLGAVPLIAAGEEPPEFPEPSESRPLQDTAVGRAKLSLRNVETVRRELEETEPEEFEEEDPELIWVAGGILPVSASEQSPVLVPLPDPPLPTAVPPAPLPAPSDVLRDQEPEALPIAPLAPAAEPGCAGCRSGAAGLDPRGSPGGYRVSATEDPFGIGSRQVPFALFHIDPVEPLTQLRLRADFANGLRTPDRVERFWAAPPLGPAQPERRVDYQTFSLYTETGGDHFAAFAEIPFVSMQSDINGDTTGLGNLVVGQKFLLTNPKNRRWQIAQILRTYLPTGPTRRGLGNGLTALEPGLLFRYRISDQTYLHGELKYWIPLAGDPDYTGRVLQYGVGASTVLWQTDNKAILSSLEVIGSSIGNGHATLPTGDLTAVNGDAFVSVLPGVRLTLGPSGDLGLFEIGASGGATFGDPGWYDSRFLLDFRWSY